jgi:hypothetical protein
LSFISLLSKQKFICNLKTYIKSYIHPSYFISSRNSSTFFVGMITFFLIFLVCYLHFLFFKSLLLQWQFWKEKWKNLWFHLPLLKSKSIPCIWKLGEFGLSINLGVSFTWLVDLNSEGLSTLWLGNAFLASLLVLAYLPPSRVHFTGREVIQARDVIVYQPF